MLLRMNEENYKALLKDQQIDSYMWKSTWKPQGADPEFQQLTMIDSEGKLIILAGQHRKLALEA